MFRILTDEKNERAWEDNRLIKLSLIDPGPQLIICDEGHILKNQHTLVFKTLNEVKTKRRIVLSGTPIKNNLLEYYALVEFVKPNLLGSTTDFRDRFLDPIDKGKSADATDRAVTYMKQQSHVLHNLLGGTLLFLYSLEGFLLNIFFLT
jgi:transcriptional regulator ATRX